MTRSNQPMTPAQQLANRIVGRLKEKKLISDKSSTSLEIKLSRGQMTSAEWRVVLEKSLEELKRK